MARYVVVDEDVWWLVRDSADLGKKAVGIGSKAEACIMAWALNHVAEGRTVVALISPDDVSDGPRYAGFYCDDYTGPTDGVA